MTEEAQRWDAALAERASPAPLLQTWAWGEVQSRAGWRVQRVRLPGGALASVQLRSVLEARHAYVPRGPVPATRESVAELVAWAREQRIARLVVEPEAGETLDAPLAEMGFARSLAIQPRYTRIVTLLAPDELLRSFRHGRRYNIRAGERRGVAVEEDADAAELARQSEAVERRESIDLPGRDYYSLLLGSLPWCRTYTAYAPETKEPLACVLVARHDGRAYSLFAGRSGRRSELMGNDVAWWAGIRAAAEAGCRDFDLWGVPPPGADPSHPWHGLGTFKSEFGGEEVAYTGAWELTLDRRAAAVLALERTARGYVRRLKRNIP